jgi:hypothetical protein
MKHNPNTNGGRNMKKVLMITLMLLISVAFVTTVFAQAKPAEKPAAAAPAPAPEKPAKAEKAEKPAKAKMMTFKGEVVKFDEAAKALVVKDAKGEATFEVGGVKKMPAVKAGDMVMVKFAEKDGKKMASSVVTPKAPKAEKKEAPKVEKKEAPKAEPAKPAEPAKK